jgi:signal transduction histidine kinase
MDTVKILIVEDELIVAHSLREALQGDGYSVVGISDSAESATRSLHQTKPDLVLLDITLKGGTDGIHLGEKIQREFEIPILYLTAYGDTATLERAKTTDPHGYLLKPYRLQEIRIAIEIALNRHYRERKIRESLQEEARIAERVKQEFLTNIKHEIRTPMNAIQGFCQLLQYEIADERPRSYLRSIQESGEELVNTLEAIVDLSRSRSGDLDRSLQIFAPRGLCGEVEYLFGPKAREKNLALVTRVSSEVPEAIRFDEFALRQMLLRLVDNAIKFTEAGTIAIEIDSRALLGEKAIELTVTVRDTGIGIPPAERERIFEPFAQGDNSVTRRYGGLGAGLAIVAGLTRHWGGTIQLESEEGEGSVFRLIFPRVEVAEEGEWEMPPIAPAAVELPSSETTVLSPPPIELLERLRVEEEKNWPNIVDTVIIGDIRTFARDLQRLGTDHDYLPLTIYADLLWKQSNEFDLDVLKTLEAFPDIVRALEREFG